MAFFDWVILFFIGVAFFLGFLAYAWLKKKLEKWNVLIIL